MYLTMFESVEKAATQGLVIDADSLYSAFEQVTDGRKKKGKRYPLPLLLTLLLLGKLAGETTVNGIVDWIKERQAWLRSQLNWPKRFPTNSTYSEALARCDAEQIVTVIANVLLKARAVEQCENEPSRLQTYKQEETLTQVAMDGKTLRGTLGHQSQGQPSVHLLSLYECHSGIVLTHRAVKSKENEISAAAALVHPALVKGRLLSTDAMHTQKKWCAWVHAYKGYYLTIVKKNHPQMYEDLVAFFDDPDAEQQEWQYAKSVQKGHGRLEQREIWTSRQMNAWLETEWAGVAQVFRYSRPLGLQPGIHLSTRPDFSLFETEWAGVAQVFRLRRSVKEGDTEREETVYGLTNLPRKKANASRLLAFQQAHWRIERLVPLPP